MQLRIAEVARNLGRDLKETNLLDEIVRRSCADTPLFTPEEIRRAVLNSLASARAQAQAKAQASASVTVALAVRFVATPTALCPPQLLDPPALPFSQLLAPPALRPLQLLAAAAARSAERAARQVASTLAVES